jgi:hypothetical protein
MKKIYFIISGKQLAIIILLCLFTLNTSAQKRYKYYNQFGRSKTSRLTPAFSIGFNAGVFFTQVIGVDNKIYKQKEFNPAYGISIEKRIFYNISLRADVAQGKLSANNFKSKPAETDHYYSFYRTYNTKINYSTGTSIVGTVPILTNKQFHHHPVNLQVWVGGGLIDFETQFIQYPETPIYYGKIINTYKHIGIAAKYRLSDFSEVGMNYIVYFYDGYNLDAVKVHGPSKDKFSFAYVSFNFIL